MRSAGTRDKGTPSVQRGRLAPRSGTTLRFGLLCVVLCLASLFMARQLNIVDAWATPRSAARNDLSCTLAAGVDPDAPPLGNTLAELHGYSMLERCRSGTGTVSFEIACAATGAVLVLAFALYWWLPSWKSRRGRLVTLRLPETDGELLAHLAALSERAGLTRIPRFAVDPRALSAGAVVFGRPRRYTVCLHAGLLARRAVDPAAFEAVVLHELAHLRNRDVDVAYATVALWRVFLAVVLLPFTVQQGRLLARGLLGTDSAYWPGVAPGLVRDIALALFLVLLVHLARADILRTRELHADADAVGWGADSDSWGPADGTLAPSTPGGKFRARLAAFTGLWRTHPTWAVRRRSLTDPEALFGVDALQMFLLGAVGVLLYSALPVGWFGLSGPDAVRVASGLAAAFVVTITGLALWRATLYAVGSGRRPTSGLRSGAWLGLGTAVGELLFGDAMDDNHLLPARPWVLLVPMVCAMVTAWWSAQWAELIIRSRSGRGRHGALVLGLPAMWAVFAAWFSWWETSGVWYAVGALFSRSQVAAWLESSLLPGPKGMLDEVADWYPLSAQLLADSALIAVGLAMWLLPLLAWSLTVVREANTDASAWKWAGAVRTHDDAGRARTLSARQSLPRLRRIALAALGGAVVCWLGQAVTMAWLHRQMPPAGQRGGGYALAYLYLILGVACLGTVAAAGTAAARSRHYRLLTALMSAGTAGIAGMAGQWAITSADGCLGPLNTLTTHCAWHPQAAGQITLPWIRLVLGPGTFVAGAAALLTVAGVSLPRRMGRIGQARQATGKRRVQAAHGIGPLPAKPRKPTAPASRGLATARRAAVLCVGAAALALTVAATAPAGLHRAKPLGTAQLVAPPPKAAVTERIRWSQVIAWTSKAGGPTTKRIVRDAERYNDTMEYAARHLVGGRLKADAIIASCAALDKDAADGAALPRIPLPRAERPWARMLDQTRKGGALCRRAVRENNGDLFGTADEAYLEAMKSGTQCWDVLERYVREAETGHRR